MISGTVSRTHGETTGDTETAAVSKTSLISRAGPSVATAVTYALGLALLAGHHRDHGHDPGRRGEGCRKGPLQR